MNKKDFLKIAGVQTEEEFYQLYPSPESFFETHKKASFGLSVPPPDKFNTNYSNKDRNKKYDETSGRYFSPETIAAFEKGEIAFPSYITPEVIKDNSLINTTQPSVEWRNLYGEADDEMFESALGLYNSAFGSGEVDLSDEEGTGKFQDRYTEQIGNNYNSGFIDDKTSFRDKDKKTGRYTLSRPIPIVEKRIPKDVYEDFFATDVSQVLVNATTSVDNDKIFDYTTINRMIPEEYTEDVKAGQFYRLIPYDASKEEKPKEIKSIDKIPIDSPPPRLEGTPIKFGELESEKPAYQIGKVNGGLTKPSPERKRKLLFEPGSIGRALDALLFWDSPDYAPLSKSEPLLYQNNYVDLQADRNEVAGNIKELERLISNNPSALGAISATAYDANNKINQQERNYNTQNRQQVYNMNVETVNKYNAVNQKLADQEMTRNFTADEMSKQNNRNLMAKMLTEIRQDRLQNRQLEMYKRIIPNVNMNPYDPSEVTFNTDGVRFSPNVYTGQAEQEQENKLFESLKGLSKEERKIILRSKGYTDEEIEQKEKEHSKDEKEYGTTIRKGKLLNHFNKLSKFNL